MHALLIDMFHNHFGKITFHEHRESCELCGDKDTDVILAGYGCAEGMRLAKEEHGAKLTKEV